MSETKGKFGEPWDKLEYMRTAKFGNLLSFEQLERARLCVNAIDGVPDPAQQVERWKAIEAAVIAYGESEGTDMAFNAHILLMMVYDDLIRDADTDTDE